MIPKSTGLISTKSEVFNYCLENGISHLRDNKQLNKIANCLPELTESQAHKVCGWDNIALQDKSIWFA